MDRLRWPRAWSALSLAAALSLSASCSRQSPPPSAPAPPAAPGARPAGPAAGAAPPTIGTKVHRQGAGAPDGTGWCLARSTEGGFSVELPAAFNDSTVTSPADAGAFVTTFLIGTTTDTGVRFSALKALRTDNKINAVSPEAIADRFEHDGKLRARRPIVHHGLDGIELEVEDESFKELFRCFLKDGALYQLSVQQARSDFDAGVTAMAERFFESLKPSAAP